MDDKSPFVETAKTTQLQPRLNKPAEVQQSVGSGIYMCMMWAIAIVLAVAIIYVLYRLTCTETFLVNTVKSDPASDWNLKSEIDKLIKLQEDYLAKRKK
jgi:hypothetical protein